MPNHIKNSLKFEGDEKHIVKLIESYSTFYEEEPERAWDDQLIYEKETADGRVVGWLDEETNIFSRREVDDVDGVPKGFEPVIREAWTRFPDFNKIVPMPESLEIDKSSLGSMVQTLLFGGEDEWMGVRELQKRMRALDEEHRKEAVDMGLKYQSNIEKYNHSTWYGWAIDQWGTKWNAYSCEQKDDAYTFETAWSNVLGLIKKISAAHPEVTIHYRWADEDTGHNCGNAVLLDGLLSIEEPEGGSKAAYDIAFDLRPDYKEDYELVDGEYVYIED